MRKSVKINPSATFEQFWKAKEEIEKRFPHIHCRLNTQRKEFEAISTKSRLELNEKLAIHELSKSLR